MHCALLFAEFLYVVKLHSDCLNEVREAIQLHVRYDVMAVGFAIVVLASMVKVDSLRSRAVTFPSRFMLHSVRSDFPHDNQP